MTDLKSRHEQIVKRVRQLTGDDSHIGMTQEAVALAQTLLHETVGGSHPLAQTLERFVVKPDYTQGIGTCRAIIDLYNQGALNNPKLQIAKELDEGVVDIAEAQFRESEKETDPSKKQLRLAISAFLVGAALEDAMRRMCDKHSVAYPSSTTLAKLQTALYSPSSGIEVISKSENAQISAWAQTRNNADHGQFAAVTSSEVQAMVIGIRYFIDKHLP